MVVIGVAAHHIHLIHAYQGLVHSHIQAGLVRACGYARTPCAVPEGVGITIKQIVERTLLNLGPQGVELAGGLDDRVLHVGNIYVADVLGHIQPSLGFADVLLIVEHHLVVVLHQVKGIQQCLGLIVTHRLQVPLRGALVADVCLTLVPGGLPQAQLVGSLASSLAMPPLVEVGVSVGLIVCVRGSIADVEDVVVVLGAHIIEAHEGVHLGTHADGITTEAGTLHACGGIDHLDILAHHAELPQLACVLLVTRAPPAPAVQATKHGNVVVRPLHHRIALQVGLAALLLGVVLHAAHDTVVAIGHAEGHQAGHDGLVVGLHLVHDGIDVLLGHRATLVQGLGILLCHSHVLLEGCPCLGVGVLAKACTDAQFIGIIGQIAVIGHEQLIDSTRECSLLIGLVNLQLGTVPGASVIDVGVCLGTCEAQSLGTSEAEERRDDVLTLVIIAIPFQFHRFYIGPACSIRCLLNQHLGGLTRVAAVSAAEYELVVTSNLARQFHLYVMRATHLAVPVTVPEGGHIVIYKPFDVLSFVIVTGRATQLRSV